MASIDPYVNAIRSALFGKDVRENICLALETLAASAGVTVDTTLTVSGKAADAMVTGDRIKALSDFVTLQFTQISNSLTDINSDMATMQENMDSMISTINLDSTNFNPASGDEQTLTNISSDTKKAIQYAAWSARSVPYPISIRYTDHNGLLQTLWGNRAIDNYNETAGAHSFVVLFDWPSAGYYWRLIYNTANDKVTMKRFSYE